MAYFRLSMDYELYNFNDFKKTYNEKNELKKEKRVVWYFTYKKTAIKENDVVVIYCSNMPDDINRYIMKANVEKVVEKSEDTKKNFKGNFEDCNSLIILKDIKMFNYENPLDLGKDKIKEVSKNKKLKKAINYGGFQGAYGEITNEKLINYIESFDTRDNVKEILDQYVDVKCFFDNHNNKDNHSTFIKNNGATYIEYHHLIFRSIGNNKNKKIQKLLENNSNYYKLCPTCHRKIHYGTNETRKKMINTILETCDEEKLKEIVKEIGNKKSLKEYLYELYKITED